MGRSTERETKVSNLLPLSDERKEVASADEARWLTSVQEEFTTRCHALLFEGALYASVLERGCHTCALIRQARRSGTDRIMWAAGLDAGRVSLVQRKKTSAKTRQQSGHSTPHPIPAMSGADS